MDLSKINPAVTKKLSDQDLEALASGDVSRVSSQGLQLLASATTPRQPMPAGERFYHRAITAPVDAGTQLGAQGNKWLSEATGGLVPRLKNDPSAEISARERDYRERKPEGVDWAGLAGDVLSPVNAAMMVVPGGAHLRGAALLGGATSGLTTPSTEDEAFWSDKGKQVLTGAVGGGASNALFRGLSRVALPNAARNPDLQLLRREGVNPSLGQALGGNWNRAEEKLASWPIVGGLIGNVRRNAVEDLNVAGLNRAGAPVAARTTQPGHQGVGEIRDAITRTYDDAIAAAGPNLRVDQAAARELASLNGMVGQLQPQEQRAYRNILDHVMGDVSPNGHILPENFKRIDSYLGEEATRFHGAGGYQSQLGDAVQELQRTFRNTAMRTTPQAATLNAAADRAHAQMVRMENAAKSASQGGQADGIATPFQIGQAVRSSVQDPRAARRQLARGDALMQDLSGAGQRVLGNKVPNSGTADRMLMAGGLSYFIDPTITAGILAGTVAYQPGMQRALVRMVSQRAPGWQQAAAVLRRFAEHSAPVGASLLDD